MLRELFHLAEKAVPRPLLIKGWAAYCRFRARKARRAFQEASGMPTYLDLDVLDTLQRSYSPVQWDYPYDKESLARRGQNRAQMLLKLVADGQEELHCFLELGAWDGMCCAALEQMGKETTGIDIRAGGFAGEAARSGVDFLQMDAAALGFEDGSFDFVFSFNSFEHFHEPDRVLSEAVRVVRPGGYIYLNFGPLYLSATGAHQFQTIHVPYNQCLFQKELLAEYADDAGIELVDFSWMNEWSVDQYRQLWQEYGHRLKTILYHEILNADHVDLIARYPSCFRSKTDNFDNFLVACIEILLWKCR